MRAMPTTRFTALLIVWSLLSSIAAAQDPGTIETIAGGGTQEGEGLPAVDLALSSPWGVAVDSAGNLYLADSANHRIRRVDASTGVATTVAGTGESGFTGDGGPGPSALLSFPQSVAVDAQGNVYIADTGNGRIRRVDAVTGIIRTIAGTGTFGFSGDGGPASEAEFGEIVALVTGGGGKLFVSDGVDEQFQGNHRVRAIDLATGLVSTVAGNGDFSFSGDGGPATEAGLTTEGIAVDPEGNLYVADFNNFRIRRVDAVTGIITTVAGKGPLFGGGGGYSGEGGPATDAQMNLPYGVAVDAQGNLYIADTGNSRIRVVEATTGNIVTVAGIGVPAEGGDGGPAMLAGLDVPARLVLDPDGNLIIADIFNNRIRRLNAPQTRLPLLELPASQVDFQTVSIGEGSSRGLSIENLGNLAFTIQQATVDNQDFAVQTELPLSVGPLQTSELIVQFTPRAEGLTEGQLVLATSDPNNPTVTILLQGKGAAPDIGVVPTELVFRRTFIGTETSLSLTVSNLGAGILTIPRAETTDPEQFVVVLPDTLRISSTAPLSIIFRPTHEDTQRAVLTLFSNDPDDPQFQVDLKGLGRAAKPGGFANLADSLSAGDAGSGFGAAWGDYDGDGDPDLYVVRSLEPNLLYRNGAGGFTEVGLAAGVGDDADGSAAAWADFDGDGDLDLYATNFGQPNRLYRNDGGRFTDVAAAMGVDDSGDGYGAAWADYDRDGDPDLYVANFGTNRFFRNDRSRFVDVAVDFGMDDPSSSVQPAWADYDNDGDPDLFLANSGPNRMFRNDGGTFTDVTRETGLDELGLGGPSFGAAWGDFNNDGYLDLYVPYFRGLNRLYINRDGAGGQRGFLPGESWARQYGVTDSTSSRSRGAVWADFDNDGDLDLYVANSGQPNRLFRNMGEHFTEEADSMGVTADLDSRGVALADFDGDGGVDIFVATQNGPDRLYRNQEANGDWLRVIPEPTVSSPDAIGTRIEIAFSDNRRAVREIAGGTSYLSQDALTASFGVDDAAVVDTLTIRWPLGIIQRVFNVPTNQPFTISEVMPLPPASIALEPVTGTLVANGIAQTDILASLLNADGEVVLLSDVPLTFSVIGAGIILGDSKVSVVDGRARVTYRVGQSAGQVAVTASSPGLANGQVVLNLLAPIGNDQAIIRTVAGLGGDGGFSGDGGLATDAELDAPRDVAVDSSGNVYISDTQNSRVRRVGADSTIATIAGDGVQDASGDDGPASLSRVATPMGLAFLPSGDLLVVDQGGQSVRRIENDTIRAFAGRGIAAFGGDGREAVQANLRVPTGVAADGNGNVWIADQFNERIRRVGPDGIISTVAGTQGSGSSGDGGLATKAKLNKPQGVAVDSVGRIFIADTGNNKIRMVDTNGIITTIAGTGSAGEYGDGGPAAAAELDGPRDVAVSREGRLYIADTGNNKVRMVDLNAGNIQTVAGTGSTIANQKEGSALLVGLNTPSGLYIGPTGTIFIADTGNNRIRELTVDYTQPTIPNLPPEDAVADFNQDGKVDFIDFLQFALAFGTNSALYDLTSDGVVGFSDFLVFVQIYERNQAVDQSAHRTPRQ
jgi:sugar lactone lactonase YvrE